MATGVRFYLLEGGQGAARERFVCRLTEKARAQGHTVYILSPDPQQAQRLDQLLWEFRPGSFIPHRLHPQDPDQGEGVLIGPGPAPEGHRDLLINLSDGLPDQPQGFQRIAEILDQDPALRQTGRTRYARYRDLGCALETHKLEHY